MTLNEIKALIESGETEHKNLDFKAAGALLDKEGNKLRLEISKDVSSFANSAGGKIIYGVEENPLRLDPFDPKRFSKERLEHALKQAARDLRRFHGAATAIERELNGVIINMKSKSTEAKPSIKLERRVVMKKLCGFGTLIGVLMSAILLLQTTFKVAAAPPPNGIKNVVLVHGAFADGSGWEAVANILKKDGYNVSVVQHPETSFAEDVKFTKAAIDRQSGPVVLVGHSYGGAVITEAGNDPKVSALVYIAAFAPDTGESSATIEQAIPPAGKGIKETSDGYLYIDPASFAADFCADIPAAKADFMARSQVLFSKDSFTSPVTSPAWKSKPSWYQVSMQDRSINPENERKMAKRANAKTTEVNSSHAAYISHPKETARLIEEAATSAPQK